MDFLPSFPTLLAFAAATLLLAATPGPDMTLSISRALAQGKKAALFVEALQRNGRNLTRESLLKSIESIKDWDPGWGLKYSYGGEARRGMSRSARLVVVKDGKWTKISDWLELQEGGRK